MYRPVRVAAPEECLLNPRYPAAVVSRAQTGLNYNARFIQLAGEINSDMPRYCVEKAVDVLNGAGKPLKNSRVLVLREAYKKDIDDLRESPALDIIEQLLEKGARVSYSDPYVPCLTLGKRKLRSVNPTPALLRRSDLAVVVTDHRAFDWGTIARNSPLILDTGNSLRGLRSRGVWRI